jgi:hypothetical protein
MAYSKSNVSIVTGGFGFSTQSAGTLPGLSNRTWADVQNKIKASGLLTRIKFRIRSTDGTRPTTFKVKIMYGAASPYSVRAVINLTTAINWTTQIPSAGYSTIDYDCTALGIQVQENDFVGFFTNPANIEISGIGSVTDTTLYYSATAQDYGVGADNATLGGSQSSHHLSLECTVQTGNFWWATDTTLQVRTKYNPIPNITSEPFYVILENVAVPTDESLTIGLETTNPTTGAVVIEKTIVIDYTGANKSITLNTSGNPSLTLGDTSDDDRCHDLHIWTDPVTGKIEVMVVNYKNGQGIDDADIKHSSITARVSGALSATGLVFRRVTFTQGTGTGATVGKLVVCRKPVVAMFDSFVSTVESDATVLARVGKYLDDAGIFTEQRYVINAGISGNGIMRDSDTHTAFRTRWNDVANGRDICAYRDVVFALIVNGLNDTGIGGPNTVNTTAKAHERAGQILGEIGKVLGDCSGVFDYATGTIYRTPCDAVVCGPIYVAPDSRSAVLDLFKNLIDIGLAMLCCSANVPYARVIDDFSSTLYASSSDSHPSDTSGSEYLARKIAYAYENNTVPLDYVNVIKNDNPRRITGRDRLTLQKFGI